MSVEIWIAYMGTVLALMSTPGPSQLLMLSNSIRYGFGRSLATVAGDLSANFLQMIVASVGLVGLIQNAREFFIVVKWIGVAYLLYMGLRLFASKKSPQIDDPNTSRSVKSLYWQAFVTSAVNPKAVIFFAALFPQFITPTEPLSFQFTILAITYLLVDGMFLSFYGTFSGVIAKKLRTRFGKHLDKISGVFLVVAAILLGLKDI